jgi:hypothetical protein
MEPSEDFRRRGTTPGVSQGRIDSTESDVHHGEIQGMTVKEEIQDLVDTLDDKQALDVLNYVRFVVGMARPTNAGWTLEAAEPPGEFLKIGRPTSDDDPLWNIVGIIGEDVDVPSDLAVNHDRYLAEIYADRHKS